MSHTEILERFFNAAGESSDAKDIARRIISVNAFALLAQNVSSSAKRLYNFEKDEELDKLTEILTAAGFVKVCPSTVLRLYIPESFVANKSDYCPVILELTATVLRIYGDSESEEYKKAVDVLSVFETEKGVSIRIGCKIDSHRDQISYDLSELKREECPAPLPSFYPWIKTDFKEYIQRFIDSKATILILIGPPGTGKTSFIRSLIFETKLAATIAYDRRVAQHPNFISDFRHGDKYPLCIMEDADVMLMPRESGNEEMASFLNYSEGVARARGVKKMVFSTNLPSIAKIDPAIMRPGRCFDILTFRELTSEEATVVATEMNVAMQDFDSKSHWTLSEVLNPPLSIQTFQGEKKKGFGFNVN